MTPRKKLSIQRPKKKETLAGKQEKKIRKWRLSHLSGKLGGLAPRRWVEAGEVLGIITLFLVNLWLLYPFFGDEDKTNAFSAPVIPLLATITEKLIPFAYGVRVWLLVFFLFLPLSFYYFVREISGRKLTGFLASLTVVLPVRIFLPLRVNLGLLGQDGSHMASLSLAPLVSVLLLQFLRQGRFWAGMLAALGTALVALISPIGFMVLATFMTIVAFSEMLLGRGRLKALRLITILLLAAGFSAFWYNPRFVLLTLQSPQGELIRRTFWNLLPVSFFLFPLLGVFGFLLFENRPQLQPMFIAFFLTVGFGAFSLGAGVAHPSPSRFLPAFGLSLAFLISLMVVWMFDFLRTSTKFRQLDLAIPHRLVAFGVLGLVFLLLIVALVFRGRNLGQLKETQVLGLTNGQKVGVWEIRQKTDGVVDFLGYGISALTVLLVGALGFSLKKRK